MICANCKSLIWQGDATGESALYNPGGGREFILCEPCFFEEDDAIEERGTNVWPERLERYRYAGAEK